MNKLFDTYIQLGGTFVTPIHQISTRLKTIKAFIFDWDGVFNDGRKNSKGGSDFSEVDSMGTNLLRYSYFLNNNSHLPLTAIISGERNETAFFFCDRECFNYSFYKIGNKIEALNFICENENIQPNEVAYFFDDVLDLPIAESCGLRIMINQKANPLFTHYCITNKLADYITAYSGGNFAIREATELLIALYGNYNEVIASRKNYSNSYKTYITKRKLIKPDFFTLKEERMEKS